MHDFGSKYLSVLSEVRRCVDCDYCCRAQYYAGLWYCNNPKNRPGVPVPHSLPCFVRRGELGKAVR